MALGILRQRRQGRAARRSLFLEALEARNLMASFTTREDTPLVVTELAPLIGQVEAKPLHGELTVFATGGFSYSPAENYHGPDRFTYLPISPTPADALVEVTLEVTPVNDAPVANDDSFSTKANTGLTITSGGLLENDRDVDSNALSVLLAVGSGPKNGTLTTNSAGVLIYKPNANYVGRDSFLYFASDGQATSAKPATVTINVEAIVHPPEARNDSYEVKQDTTLVVEAPGVLANDGSNTGPRLNAVLVAGVGDGNGSLTLNADGSVKYVPPTGFSGKVSFTYRAFVPDTTTPPTAANPGTISNIATVTITVKPTPPPEARPDQYGMEQGGVLTVEAPGVLKNDGSDGGPKLYASVVAAPANGTLTLNADGSFVYTPKPEFFGLETFTYRASDKPPTVADPGTAPSNSSIAKVYISVRPKGPIALPDKYEINFGQKLEVAAPGVLGNDSSANGEVLFASLVEKPRGTLTLNANGSFVYVPPTGFSGTDSFKYRASIAVTSTDPAGSAPNTIGAIAVVTIFVRPGARDDQYLVFQNTPLAVKAPGVLANDGSATDDRKLYAYPERAPEHGTLVLNSDGSFVYTPNADYTGPDTFTYRASVISPESASPIREGSIATVHLHVVRRDPPEARNDVYATPVGVTLVVDKPGVLKNDGVPGQVLVATLVDKPSQGELTFNSDGSFKYVPAINFAGEVKFTYRASTPATNTDPTTGPILSNVATVTIVVGPIVSPPIAQNDKYEMRQGGELKVDAPGVLANDRHLVNVNLVATLESGPANGELKLNADGSFLYVPKAGFSGVDTFKYRARPVTTTSPGTDPATPTAADTSTDPATGSIATVTIVVHPVNPIPRAQDDKYTTGAGHELVVEKARGVLANDGAATTNVRLVASLESDPGNGRVSLNADGSFTYVPATGFTGIDSFTYRASIPTTASGTILPDSGSVATVYINVITPIPFHNVSRPKDVNGDRTVSTIDAVLIINRMNNPVPFTIGGGEPSDLPCVDVSGDGQLTTIDAVLVINELNTPQAIPETETEPAEGEFSFVSTGSDANLEATLAALTCDPEELAARKRKAI